MEKPNFIIKTIKDEDNYIETLNLHSNYNILKN